MSSPPVWLSLTRDCSTGFDKELVCVVIARAYSCTTYNLASIVIISHLSSRLPSNMPVCGTSLSKPHLSTCFRELRVNFYASVMSNSPEFEWLTFHHRASATNGIASSANAWHEPRACHGCVSLNRSSTPNRKLHVLKP